LINKSAIVAAWLIGIAKPSPILRLAAKVRIAELTPTTRPPASTSGPPEFPGLMEASVWMAFMYAVGESAAAPSDTITGRFRAEMMPCVTVPGSPSGEPTAITGSPTWI
jgi:hypothetical protein